jgi:transposase-like protein
MRPPGSCFRSCAGQWLPLSAPCFAEGFVGGVNSARRSGRDRIGKQLVVVAVEVRGAGSGRLRLASLPDASGASLGGFVSENITAGSTVHTDGWRGYDPLASLGYEHRPVAQRWRTEERQVVLPRAHRALSNLKTWLQGTHRGTSAKHLQVYLDEFVFRHNRRRTPMAAFQTLLGLSTGNRPTTYEEITANEAA